MMHIFVIIALKIMVVILYFVENGFHFLKRYVRFLEDNR